MLSIERAIQRLEEYGDVTVEVAVKEEEVVKQTELRAAGLVCTGMWTDSKDGHQTYLLFEWINDLDERERRLQRFRRLVSA